MNQASAFHCFPLSLGEIDIPSASPGSLLRLQDTTPDSFSIGTSFSGSTSFNLQDTQNFLPLAPKSLPLSTSPLSPRLPSPPASFDPIFPILPPSPGLSALSFQFFGKSIQRAVSRWPRPFIHPHLASV